MQLQFAADSMDLLQPFQQQRNTGAAAVVDTREIEFHVAAVGGNLRLHNCPAALARIAEFSNVDGLLGLEPA